MKCFIEDFRELDIDELLAVNGGYGSSSRSYGKGSGGGDDSNSSTTSDPISVNSPKTSWEVWDANKDGRNSSGEITRPHDPYRDATRNSGQYKAPSFVPDNTLTNGGKKDPAKEVDLELLPNSDNILPSGTDDVLTLPTDNVDVLPTDDGVELPNVNGDVIPNDNNANCGNDDGVNFCEQQNSLDPNVNNEDSGNNTILDSINENRDKIYNENGNGYCCDNWVEEVLSDAGYDPSEFMNGDSTATVQEHIDNLEDGSYTTSVPNEEGSYVVYMNNSENSDYNYVAHAGILTVESDGTMTFHHNSSSNDNNGVASEVVTSFNGTTFDGYGYDSFYFQQIN